MTPSTIVLLVTLVLAMVAAPRGVAAPRLAKVSRIGVLWFGDPWDRPLLEAFSQALRGLGWVDGQNLRVEFRDAFSRVDQFPKTAKALGLTMPPSILFQADEVIR